MRTPEIGVSRLCWQRVIHRALACTLPVLSGSPDFEFPSAAYQWIALSIPVFWQKSVPGNIQ